MNPETHACDCGFTWRHGHSGAHSCEPYYRKTISELRAAAAPQVVADEADCECQVPPFGWRCTRGAGHDGPCAAVECPEDVAAVKRGMERLAAAPVQAQEPVLVQAFEESGSDRESGAWFDIAASEANSYTDEGYKVRKLFAAPVQPVAVPDGDALVNAMCKAGLANDHGRRTLLNGEEIGFDLLSLMAIVRIAAPAAQGDAKDAELIAELRSVYTIYNGHGEDLRDLAERAANRIAAIAAKAAS